MGVFWQRKGVSIIYPQQLEGAKRIVCEKQLEGSGLAPPDRIMAVRHKEECRTVSRHLGTFPPDPWITSNKEYTVGALIGRILYSWNKST